MSIRKKWEDKMVEKYRYIANRCGSGGIASYQCARNAAGLKVH